MLKHENAHPRKLAYDRPSPKLKGFLSKHYGLKNFVPQSNNFIVFDDYFEDTAKVNQIGPSDVYQRSNTQTQLTKPY